MLDLARKSEILSEIAETLASETEFSSNGLLLVAAVDRGFLSLSLFSDCLLYTSPSPRDS